MRKRKYRAGVAAVLAGAALFSPLLCGMDCLTGHGIGPGSATEIVAPAAGEFLGDILESGAFGCGLVHVVLSVDWDDWADLARVGSWIRVAVEAVGLVEGRLS